MAHFGKKNWYENATGNDVYITAYFTVDETCKMSLNHKILGQGIHGVMARAS